MPYLQDDWDSDFDDESVSQVGGPGGAPAAAAQNNYAQHQVIIVGSYRRFFLLAGRVETLIVHNYCKSAFAPPPPSPSVSDPYSFATDPDLAF